MDQRAQLIALVLSLMGRPVPHPHDIHYEMAASMAFLIRDTVRAENAERVASWKAGASRPAPLPVDIVAGVVARESSFKPDAVGKRGELGLMQVKPDGAALRLCRDLLGKLSEPRANLLCGVRILRDARDRCGPNPLLYLGRFNGTQECRETSYARRVMSKLGASLPREVAER